MCSTWKQGDTRFRNKINSITIIYD
ncbi:hypothetical protein [Chryseobacterium carnipullorum]